MPEIIDDKSEHCIPFILERIKQHCNQYEAKNETPPPFFVGLNGVQGAGKTTLVGPIAIAFLSIPVLWKHDTDYLCCSSLSPTAIPC
jgi:D-glycerate 3-kinase